MTTIFITFFIKNIPELLVPYLKAKAKSNKKKDPTPVEHPFL
jgi:hypothetical protein